MEFEHIKFDNKYYNKVKEYLENNENFNIDPFSLLTPKSRGHPDEVGLIYSNKFNSSDDDNFMKNILAGVILTKTKSPGNLGGLLSITKNNPLKEEIKLNLEKITN
jgi:hypothetical protein